MINIICGYTSTTTYVYFETLEKPSKKRDTLNVIQKLFQVKKEEAFSKENEFGGNFGGPGGPGDDPFGGGGSGGAHNKPSLDLAFKEGQTIRYTNLT